MPTEKETKLIKMINSIKLFEPSTTTKVNTVIEHGKIADIDLLPMNGYDDYLIYSGSDLVAVF